MCLLVNIWSRSDFCCKTMVLSMYGYLCPKQGCIYILHWFLSAEQSHRFLGEQCCKKLVQTSTLKEDSNAFYKFYRCTGLRCRGSSNSQSRKIDQFLVHPSTCPLRHSSHGQFLPVATKTTSSAKDPLVRTTSDFVTRHLSKNSSYFRMNKTADGATKPVYNQQPQKDIPKISHHSSINQSQHNARILVQLQSVAYNNSTKTC